MTKVIGRACGRKGWPLTLIFAFDNELIDEFFLGKTVALLTKEGVGPGRGSSSVGGIIVTANPKLSQNSHLCELKSEPLRSTSPVCVSCET